jgi:prepilin-type N-terminal cleavage/methylation domain-containing protein
MKGTTMLKRLRAARENEDGFTLIELLLVIIILGVLAGIVVFAVNGISDRGNASACKADKKNVEIAAEAFYSKYGRYATFIDSGTLADPPNDLVRTGFLRESPKSDQYEIHYDNKGKVTVSGNMFDNGSCT